MGTGSRHQSCREAGKCGALGYEDQSQRMFGGSGVPSTAAEKQGVRKFKSNKETDTKEIKDKMPSLNASSSWETPPAGASPTLAGALSTAQLRAGALAGHCPSLRRGAQGRRQQSSEH